MIKYLVVDGMLHGTGVRDYYGGGYVQPELLDVSSRLKERLRSWLIKYEEEHYNNYSNKEKIDELDLEGINIAKALKEELQDCKISYYSNASLQRVDI